MIWNIYNEKLVRRGEILLDMGFIDSWSYELAKMRLVLVIVLDQSLSQFIKVNGLNTYLFVDRIVREYWHA